MPVETEADAGLLPSSLGTAASRSSAHTCTQGLPQSGFLGGGRGHAAAVCPALQGSCAHRTLASPHRTVPQGQPPGLHRPRSPALATTSSLREHLCMQFGPSAVSSVTPGKHRASAVAALGARTARPLPWHSRHRSVPRLHFLLGVTRSRRGADRYPLSRAGLSPQPEPVPPSGPGRKGSSPGTRGDRGCSWHSGPRQPSAVPKADLLPSAFFTGRANSRSRFEQSPLYSGHMLCAQTSGTARCAPREGTEHSALVMPPMVCGLFPRSVSRRADSHTLTVLPQFITNLTSHVSWMNVSSKNSFRNLGRRGP